MKTRLLKLVLEWCFLTTASPIFKLRFFPWGLWNIHIKPGANCLRPIVLSDSISKVIGSNFSCQGNLVLGGTIQIGDNVGVNHNVFIVGGPQSGISIGNYVLIGPNVVLRSSDHDFSDPDKPIRLQGHIHGTIVIEDDVWLGANVVVTKNVRIGKGSVIGAGSVVTKDIPPYSVAVGTPARVISSRRKNPA